MLEELVAIIKLKQDLRDAAVSLAENAEVNPDHRIAVEYLRLATLCQELEREIDLAANSVLDAEIPKGIA